MHGGIVAAVAAVVAVGCAAEPPSRQDLRAAFDRSIALAAVKTKAAERALTPITEEEVVVAHLQTRAKINTSYDVWVALVEDLRAHCLGKPDPLLALQMALGLPPVADTDDKVHKVFVFSVRRDDLFRPCASSSDVRAPGCKLEVKLEKDDKHRPFVLRQMIESYRRDRDQDVKRFPFTAMGWSYNWDPTAKTTMGISEYVVRLNAPLAGEWSMTPAQFCAPRLPLRPS